MPVFNVQHIFELMVSFAPRAVGALVVFIVGCWLAGKSGAALRKIWQRSQRLDPVLVGFFASFVRFWLLFLTFIIALSILGIDVTAFSSVILGAGAALAFILKDSLSDIAAGVMLIIFRPYKIGDEIEAGGKKGVVQDIGLLATRLKTRDNIEIIIGNNKCWSGVICNHNALGTRRLDKVFRISYDSDIDTAIRVLKKVAACDARVLSEPPVWAKVIRLGDYSIDIELRFWVKYDDHRKIKMDISQQVKTAFDAAGTQIPYPHETKIKRHVRVSKSRERLSRTKKQYST